MEIAIPCTTKKLKGTSFYNWQPSANEENMAQAFAHLCEEVSLQYIYCHFYGAYIGHSKHKRYQAALRTTSP